MLLSRGERFGSYVVEADHPLGIGACATVFPVVSSETGALLALKILTLSGPAVHARFVREAEVQARLKHDHIVQVYELLSVHGQPALVMERLECTLADQIAEVGPLPIDVAIPMFSGMVSGVAAIHEARIVHRDLKPSNLLFDHYGRLKVSDFGIAKHLADAGPSMTRLGTTMGTMRYMAPELRGAARLADERSDIFALGCILAEMITGESPFDLDNFTAFDAMGKGELRLPASLPLVLSATIRRATHPDQARRYPDCGALLASLHAAAFSI